MMKNRISARCLLGCILFAQLAAYQPDELGGLLETITGNQKPAYLAKEPLPRVFEKDAQGNNSCVLRIEGLEQFKQFVLACPKPVVVLVWAATSLDSQKMKPVFMQVAEQFKDSVLFASMDLLMEQNKELPNYQIVAQIMQSQNINKIDIPLTVFFNGGSLFTPSYYPPAFLQGLNSPEGLAKNVKDKFFPEIKALGSVAGTDLTVTTTTPIGASGIVKAPKSTKPKKPWWRRLFGN